MAWGLKTWVEDSAIHRDKEDAEVENKLVLGVELHWLLHLVLREVDVSK